MKAVEVRGGLFSIDLRLQPPDCLRIDRVPLCCTICDIRICRHCKRGRKMQVTVRLCTIVHLP
jgi:hypothetical protein